MFRARSLDHALESRKLGGYFNKVISVHPLAGLFESKNDKFGDSLITWIDELHVSIEGKIGINRIWCFILLLNLLLAQIRLVQLLLIMANIGKFCIVGAGSVVAQDILDYSVAVGNPAKVIKYRKKERYDV